MVEEFLKDQADVSREVVLSSVLVPIMLLAKGDMV
jgi:hypothetical protein